jgi:hypothetical protein
VVQPGSDRSWNRHHGDSGDYLDRYSVQRMWLKPEETQLILEPAFLDHSQQKVTFLGVAERPQHTEIYIRVNLGIDLART